MVKRKSSILSLPLYKELSEIDNSFFNSELGFEHPKYINDNMVHTFRDYQEIALRYFHYTQASDSFKYRKINHVLFNMATGSGKTDLMAGLILYLYKEHHYQNFVFTVNTNSVLNKTVDNLINIGSDKYLYKNPIDIDGDRIFIESVNQFPKYQNKNTIYIKLNNIQTISSDLYTQKENVMGVEDYAVNKLVVLADEAHHYSASTKTEKENEKSWEKAVNTILNAHDNNLLLEFTATIDLNDGNLYEKYKDKIIYRYTLDRFIIDGFSKNVKRIQSSNSDKENMLNVVLLSEYRRRFAIEVYDTYIKPVILFKSQKVADSNYAEQTFNQLIKNLNANQVEKFINRQLHLDAIEDSQTLEKAYEYYISNLDKLHGIIQDIKREFSPIRIINANDSDRSNLLEKGQYEALNSLENPENLYRVVFAVAKLTEGWDVLNLYDIVRISDPKTTSGNKKSTTSEAQLIGRGARYNPFIIDGKRSYTRRFEDDSAQSLLLETIHYHTINEPQYLKNLVESLDSMNLPTGRDGKNPLLDVKIKRLFKGSDAWKKGKIYYNETIKLEYDYYNGLDKYGIDIKNDVNIKWKFTTKEVDYRSNELKDDYTNTHNIPLVIDKRYFKKAMSRLTFYHFENLKRYIPLLKSREEFLEEKWLNIRKRTFFITVPKSMSDTDITPKEKLDILENYLKDVSNNIRNGYRKEIGTNNFIGYPIKEYVSDYKKRVLNFDTSNKSILQIQQKVSRFEFKEDFFVYDSAIINQTEKQLIDQISLRVQELRKKYDEVYLIRMDENMHRESPKGEDLKLHQFNLGATVMRYEGFQPDFILYLSNAEFHVQIFIEPKGLGFVEKEQWKEDLLLYINENEDNLLFEDEINGLKIKGLKFYTINDGRNSIDQLGEIALGEKFKSLSYKGDKVEIQKLF